jgi:hypothetical protein
MSFNLIFEKVCKSLIKEGGNAVPGVKRIKKTFINKTIKKFKKEVVEKFLGFDPQNSLFLIGSTGKKDESGDIDLALDANILKNNNILLSLIKLNEICSSQGYLSVINTINYDMIHVAFPQVGNERKLVQIDLLLTKFPEFTDFFMFSPSPKQSKYKGAHRNELLHAICKVISYRPIEKDMNDQIVKWSQMDISYNGIFIQYKTLIDENGNRLKYKNTNEDLEESYAKIEREIPVLHDVNKVIIELVGKRFDITDIDSFEKLFEIIKNNDDFKFKNISNEILEECAKSLKEKEKRLVFPAELNEYLKED